MPKAKIEPVVASTRSSRIRRDHQNNAAVEDARDSDQRKVVNGAPAALTPEVVTSDLQIDLTRPVDPTKMTSLAQQVAGLKIVDADSHGRMLTLLKAAKMLYRIADDHWKAITRRIDAMKSDMLTLAAKDRGPLKAIIDMAEASCNAWQREEERRVEREAEANRMKAEADAQVLRDKQLADVEAAALALEASSPKLSVRELTFVDHYFVHGDATQAAKRAQYQNPAAAGAKLLATTKIAEALDVKRQAYAQREQAAAVAQTPLRIEQAPAPVAQTAKVAGIQHRVYYKCVIDNESKLRDAFRADSVPAETFTPDQSYLDKQAGMLKDSFEAAFPGCRLVKTDRIAG